MKFLSSLSLLILLMAPLAQATSFAPREFSAGVQDAPNILRGKVGMTYSDWGKSSDGARRLYTFYELQIEEVFKGSITGRSLVMRELGGQKDGIGMEVPGSAKFSRGEDVVVFLNNKNPEGSHDLRGLMMGKYGIAVDSDRKEYLTGAGISGEMAHADEDEHGHRDIAPPTKKWTLDSLRQLIAAQALAQPTPAATPTPSATGEAPRLQSPTPTNRGSDVSPSDEPSEAADTEEQQTSLAKGLGWGIAGLALIALLAWVLRKRRS
jgi:hypothetical protein